MTYAYTVPEPQPALRCDYFLDTEPQRPCGRPAVWVAFFYSQPGRDRREAHGCRFHGQKRLEHMRIEGWVVHELEVAA